jgi:hypothetical protein
MKTGLFNPKSAAILSMILCLPFLISITVFFTMPLESEPIGANPDRLNVMGGIVGLGSTLLVLLGMAVNLIPIIRAIRTGGRITSHPVNLVLAVGMGIILLAVIIGIVVD